MKNEKGIQTENQRIRTANQEDAVIISLLGRVTFTETFGHLFEDNQDLLDYLEQTFSVHKIESSIVKPKNKFWIAYVNKLPVGYAKLKLNSKSSFIDSDLSCQLQKIYVLKQFLAMKIGSKLQDTVIHEAKKLGFDTLWLSVLHTNQRAIRFYEKNKFASIGNHNFRIGKENFYFNVMSRSL